MKPEQLIDPEKPLLVYKKTNPDEMSVGFTKNNPGEWYLTEYLPPDKMVSVGDRVRIWEYDRKEQEYKPTEFGGVIKFLDDCYGHKCEKTDSGWRYLVQFEEVIKLVN